MSHQHLHLDLALGARAELIIGALLAVGAPRTAALEALGAVGLAEVGLDEAPVQVRGLLATAARLVIPGELERAPLELRRRERVTRRGRVARARRSSARRPGEGAAGAAVAEVAALPVPGALTLPVAPVAPRGPRFPETWRQGGSAAVTEIVTCLSSSSLPPLEKALAHKAARRLAAALTRVAGADARLHGLAALRTVAELAVISALVNALAPAAITASPVGLGSLASDTDGVVGASAWPAPSPWVLEILAGVPLLEHDAPWVMVDAAGAASAWALAHRFGARGVTGFARQGLGALSPGAPSLGTPGGGPLARALVGPPVPLATRAGDPGAVACALVSTSVPADAATPMLVEELRAHGARDIRVTPEVVPLGGPPRHGVALTAPAAVVDDVCAALWRGGADEVVRSWADRWTPGRVEVTVTLGRGRTKATVRVAVTSSAGRVVRVEPVLDDVRLAARRARRGEHAIAAEAAEAAVRMAGAAVGGAGGTGGMGGSSGEDGQGGDDDDDGR